MIETDVHLKKTLAKIAERKLLPTNKIVKEAIEFLRAVPYPKPDSQSIIRARALLSNNRSILIERRLLLMHELTLLNGAKTDLQDYLNSKYANFLGSVKNRQGRDSKIGHALQPISARVRRLQAAVDALNSVIGDYDSKAHAMYGTIEALKFGEREA